MPRAYPRLPSVPFFPVRWPSVPCLPVVRHVRPLFFPCFHLVSCFNALTLYVFSVPLLPIVGHFSCIDSPWLCIVPVSSEEVSFDPILPAPYIFYLHGGGPMGLCAFPPGRVVLPSPVSVLFEASHLLPCCLPLQTRFIFYCYRSLDSPRRRQLRVLLVVPDLISTFSGFPHHPNFVILAPVSLHPLPQYVPSRLWFLPLPCRFLLREVMCVGLCRIYIER